MLYIYHKSIRHCLPSMPVYEARWMHRDDYNQICVSPRMLSDHVPDAVVRVLCGLAQQYQSDFSSVSIQPRGA